MAAAPGLLALIVGPPTGLLRQAALQAFWSFGSTSLSWVARMAGVRLSSGMSLFEKLDGLVRGILPELSDDEVMDILRKRLKVSSLLDELAADDSMAELVDEQDKKQFQEVVDGVRQEKATLEVFRDEWREKKRQHTARKTQGGREKQKKTSYRNLDGRVIFGGGVANR